jgi:hypothetical protein
MQVVYGKICPSCGYADSSTANLCNFCGKELYPSCYRIVPDGKNFGITLNGSIVYHGLTLTKAQQLMAILNSTEEDEVA